MFKLKSFLNFYFLQKTHQSEQGADEGHAEEDADEVVHFDVVRVAEVPRVAPHRAPLYCVIVRILVVGADQRRDAVGGVELYPVLLPRLLVEVLSWVEKTGRNKFIYQLLY